MSALLSLCSTSAFSGGAVGVSDEYTLAIRGYVPVICRASVEANNVVPVRGQASLGRLREFCNSPNGYEVWLDHTPGLAGAAMVVDGERVEFSPGSATLLSKSTHAAVASRNLAMEMPRDGMAGHMSIRVVAL
ncbi:hypothetical protein [Brevundimonas sp. Root1423]|uniref:hypothetical protein n=1 Tax=Brevundimonas sp. Root1423 TaxID=1736462 RepID=UPI0012E3DFFB|nr:hypothetical protein [Brevundimonas sp. Root1423]